LSDLICDTLWKADPSLRNPTPIQHVRKISETEWPCCLISEEEEEEEREKEKEIMMMIQFNSYLFPYELNSA
jgi:hypothetical protein